MNATLEEKPTKKKSEPRPQKEIPQDKLRGFVGEVKNLYKIDAHLVHPNGKFRINVWTKTEKEDCVIPHFHLTESYYVYYTPTGEILDETIRKPITKESVFK